MHLAASMRVVASHLHMRRATIDTARDAVIDAARVIKAGTAEPEIATLVARLEKGTGLASPSWATLLRAGSRCNARVCGSVWYLSKHLRPRVTWEYTDRATCRP